MNNHYPISSASKFRSDIKHSIKPLNIAFGLLASTPLLANAASDYLKEPTKEFIDEQKKVDEFKAAKMKIRNKWDSIIAKLESATNSEELEVNIKDLTSILVEMKDIPIGVKKESVVKICRKQKFAGTKKKQPIWTTEVFILKLFLRLFHNYCYRLRYYIKI